MTWQNRSQQLKEAFEQDGYLVVAGFFSPAEAEDLNARIDRYIAEILPKLPSDAAFYEVQGRDETIMRLQSLEDYEGYFRELFFSDRFVKLAELLLDDKAVPKNLQWFNKPPRVGKVTPPHQDGFYFMLEPNEALTMWLALDRVDEENGCLRYVPGSHRQDIRPHRASNVLGFSQGITDFGEADEAAEGSVCAEPGDLIVHHSMTIHRADPNSSERPRRALGFVYYAGRAREDAERREAYQKQLMEKWTREGKV